MKNCKYEKKRNAKSIMCMRDGSVRNKGCFRKCPFCKEPWWLRLLKEMIFHG